MTRDMTELAGALSPVVAARGLELVDVEVQGAQLTVFEWGPAPRDAKNERVKRQ